MELIFGSAIFASLVCLVMFFVAIGRKRKKRWFAIASIVFFGVAMATTPPSSSSMTVKAASNATKHPKPSKTDARVTVFSPSKMGPINDEDKAYMTSACNTMYPNGNGYAFDFGDGNDDNANLRIVTCGGDADQLMYFRKEHLSETKDRYAHDGKPPGTPGGDPVPKP